MMNFTFWNPTRIAFGKGQIAQLDSLIPASARVLILFGGSSAERNGTLGEVRTALGKREVGEFGGIEANPAYETLMQAVARIRTEGWDFLLAVGGGSVIDGTKFVAAAAGLQGDPWQILETRGGIIKSAMPFGTVLTLSATGSEMNSGAVITRRETRTKLPFMSDKVYPLFSVLDPEKTFSVPPDQLANGIVDAYVHILEQYLTRPSGAMVQDAFAESLLALLIKTGPAAMLDPTDYTLRANLMWIATLALNGLIGAGVPHDWATHAVGHELTALYGVDHARSLALVLPGMLKVRRAAKREKLLQYARNVWKTEGDEEASIDQAIAATAAFFNQLGVATRLGDVGLDARVIDEVTAQLTRHGMTALGEDQDVTPAMVRDVLTAAL